MNTALIIAAPAPNFYAEISPEISEEIQEFVVAGEYRAYLDYNGDGALTISDAVCVGKRYENNCKYGNEITLDREEVYSIIAENYTDDCIYWEIDRVNGETVRQYNLTVDDITTAEIYLEFENNSECIEIELNPFTECIAVLN